MAFHLSEFIPFLHFYCPASGLLHTACATMHPRFDLSTSPLLHCALQEQETWESGRAQEVEQIEKRDRLQPCDRMDSISAHHSMWPEGYGLCSSALKALGEVKKPNSQR